MHSEQSQQSRWWDWAAIGLLFILLQTVASRLVATTWTPFLSLVQTFSSIGFAIGMALGYSRFQRPTVRWLTFFYMVIMLPLQWTLVIDQHASLEEQLSSVAGRLVFSTSDFFARRPVQDPFFFVAVMSVAFWIISSWAAFTLVRNQNYLGSVLPAAIGLLVIQNYDNGPVSRLWFLAFFAFVALLLLGRLQFLQNKRSWFERRIFLSPDNSVDLTSSMAIAASLIIIVAWTIPASISGLDSFSRTWNRITQPWQEFSNKMENAVSALQSSTGGRGGEFFGSNLSLGRGFPLSDVVMFQVKAPSLLRDEKPPRYYWRGRVYDYFSKGQWHTTGTVREDFSPENTNPLNANTEDKTLARFVFYTGKATFSMLYSPSEPVWVSRPGSIMLSSTGGKNDPVFWNAQPVLLSGETYQVDALLSNPNTEQLRGAGTDYPDWIKNKYVQLPDGFSPRIKELAKEVTAGAETPYDKANAITDYLRKTIQYSATISEIPRNRDPLEWILFEYKKGYCVYYATSEVLMLRSLGIPARMAVGFAQGTAVTTERGVPEQELSPTTYTVLKRNAHAWPEVYFPGVGWIEFEPTANQIPLSRPLPRQDSVNGNNPLPQDLRKEADQFPTDPNQLDKGLDTTGQTDTPIKLGLYLLPLLIFLVTLTVFLSYRYALPARFPVFLHTTIERTGIEIPTWVIRWEKWVKLSPIERAFESINFGLRQLDQPAAVHITPIERAAKLTRILPNEADNIKILLDEHQTSLYTSRIADVTQARHAALDIRKQVILERIRYLFSGKPLH
ncbi:MAG TPA: transglutaminase-like domain-containing protein [Anaerolineales bacterium]|nr:transglutaminase-like domain-containing protein [Anaerolineales bacterium]